MIPKFPKFLSFLIPSKNEKPIPTVPNIDDIYVRLRLALSQISETALDLGGRATSSGFFMCFSENLVEFNKSIVEINAILREDRHVEGGIFYADVLKRVKFDTFLFVEDGFYAKDVPVKVNHSIELISEYFRLMEDAGEALYGYKEHNHRQLYQFTNTLTGFLNHLIQHFGE